MRFWDPTAPATHDLRDLGELPKRPKPLCPPLNKRGILGGIRQCLNPKVLSTCNLSFLFTSNSSLHSPLTSLTLGEPFNLWAPSVLTYNWQVGLSHRSGPFLHRLSKKQPPFCFLFFFPPARWTKIKITHSQNLLEKEGFRLAWAFIGNSSSFPGLE